MSKIDEILSIVYSKYFPEQEDIISLLSLKAESELEALFNFADKVRKEYVGDGILIRGIIEFSNYCRNACCYCGLNRKNSRIKRYRLSKHEILNSVEQVVRAGIKTVVLQSGEDNDLNPDWLSEIIAEIKAKFTIAVTLSVGERSYAEYRLWREAGADRYLLKIETSDPELYQTLHPGMSFENRFRCIKQLKQLGYQTGSGNIIGLKGQTLETIANDILFFKQEGLDMIGIGPFISHPGTELANEINGDALLTLKTIAITRIVTKYPNIPATTALGSLGHDYRIEGLKSGANVLMLNFTPFPYRKYYEIYPGKRCVEGPVGASGFWMESLANSIGRYIDYSIGDTITITRK
ncbi:MAG: [FeFe] hydrogenase H-cluster radical SAM maturase HydE [bacterium]|nr:[FeFe] hydrogenase H-cluster radical SAM maturase HydE [bacterium]